MKDKKVSVSKGSQARSIGHIVSHTHWDREWRYPMWETRLMLVDFMDELIDVLEKGIYPGFLLDSQVAPILDYLDVRPEMADRIKALVRADKLHIGPWYTLPDEYPVDGEAMVRNLLWGVRKSKELGGTFKVGYTSFGWGQTAQLPQLYGGFGMDVAMVGKRVGKHRAPDCEFIWRAPDGTELLATRFGEWGRQNFYFKIHLSSLFGIYHEGMEWRYNWADGGIAYHRADREQMEQDHFRLDAPVKWHPETITPELMEECWKTMDESLLSDDRLMMNGCDYTAAQKMFPQMLNRLNEVDPDKARQWIHTTMPKYVELMRNKLDRSKLAVVEGELRDGPAPAITGNALTTRLYLKRKNKRAQNMLIRFAEPLSIMASMVGAPLQEPLLRKGWQFLLDSHPHDSVNGVMQDKSVNDVSNRLDQVIDISNSLGNRAMQELVRRIDMSGFEDDDVLIVVFNSLPYARREIMETWVNMPSTAVKSIFGEVDDEGIVMFDADGSVVATQWQGCSQESYCVAEMHTRAFPLYCRRHKLFFDTGQVPAGGYKVFRAAGAKGKEKQKIKSLAVRSDAVCRTGTLLTSPNSMENELLSVEMNSNGTFNLIDKRNDITFKNLNYYEDRGENGDYWVNKRPMFDKVYSSIGSSAKIWSEASGPLQATLVSEITMSIPGRGITPQQRRGDDMVDITIRTSVTLRAGQGHVEVSVDFENRHQDHYLRAMFPTGLSNATHADAGGHFIVDSRPIRPQGPDDNAVWPDMATLPQNNFVDVSDGTTGLAFLNDGITEYEVVDNKDRIVALSLLRSVKNWICTEIRAGSEFPSQKGGQCFGDHNVRYAIMPHSGNWQNANIPLAAELFNVPAIPVQTRKNKGKLPAAQASLFEISNSAVRFSTLKKAHDRDTVVVRTYNPAAKTQKTEIRFAASIEKAWLCDLNEERLEAVTLKNNNLIMITLPPHKIITLEVKAISKGK